MKTRKMVAILPVFMLAIASAAHAAADPWTGTWFRHGKNGAPDRTLTVTPAAGGYTFTERSTDVPYDIPFAVIPDGKLHTVTFQDEPVNSICRRKAARAITCNLDLAGMKRKVRYELSTDGKSLSNTETDPMASAKVSAQSKTTVSGDTAKSETSMSAPQTTDGGYTSTTVYRKQ